MIPIIGAVGRALVTSGGRGGLMQMLGGTAQFNAAFRDMNAGIARFGASLRVEVKGVREVQAAIRDFSERRLAAAIATALTRTAGHARAAVQEEMRRGLDSPRPFTINAVRIVAATAQRLEARVEVRPDSPVLPALRTLVEGGDRPLKRMDAAIARRFGLPSGWDAVPGSGAELDRYGNIRRSQLARILAGGGGGRGNRTYFALPARAGKAPGVYGRLGREIEPVILFVPATSYRRETFDFYGAGRRAVAQRYEAEFRRAVQESLARMRRR